MEGHTLSVKFRQNGGSLSKTLYLEVLVSRGSWVYANHDPTNSSNHQNLGSQLLLEITAKRLHI